MARKTEWPKEIKSGPAVVKIYRVRHSTASKGFAYTLSFKGLNGKRTLKQFSSEKEAIEEARIKASQLGAGKLEAANISEGDRELLCALRELCGDIPPPSAVLEWKRARDLTAGQIIAAAEHWAARTAASFQPIEVSSAINAFIQSKQKAGKQGERTYRAKLSPLAIRFPDRTLHSISAQEFTSYLEQFNDGVTRNDFRKRTVALCRWAQKQNYLPKHISLEIEATERAAEKKTQIGIITPPVFGKLLQFFRRDYPELLPAVVLAGFCGIRSDEIHGKRENRDLRQLWEDIHLDRKFVQVTIAKTNTPSWRIVSLCEAAVDWLRLSYKTSGPVCDAGAMERVRSVALKADFVLPENCFRHSFISYRIAITGNKPAVATEAGNSVAEIDRRYRVPVAKDVGELWFSMSPKQLEQTSLTASGCANCVC